ncbi:MAG: LptF/LptG family permease [Halanaerobiaceae bacterium]
MKIIHKYIYKELLVPFGFGVAAFTGIFIGTDLLYDLTEVYIEFGVSVLTVIRLFFLSLPPIIVYTFPMATLLGTVMCYNRLSGDGEVVALRAGGISIYWILVPALVLGLVMSVLTIGINEIIVPRSNYIYNQMMTRIRRGEVRPRTQSNMFWNPVNSQNKRPEYVLYAGHFNADTGVMTDVFLQDYYQDRPSTVVKAKEARWLDSGWYFFDGAVYHLREGARVPEINFERWEAGQIKDGPEDISLGSKKIEDMNMRELAEYIAMKEEQGQQVNEEKVEWHARLSIPFANLIFVLFAAPMGIKRQRSGGSTVGMGLSILVIFIYYIFLSVGEALGTRGAIAPWLGAWLQNIIFVLLGAIMWFKAGQ